MRRKEKNRQLNNAGFSLLELLVAVVVLAIVVIPLMNSFITSIRINAKSERTMDATAIAESVMEQFEAHTIEEMYKIYEKTGWDIEETPESDAEGRWLFAGTDKDTTGKLYQVEVTLDPASHTAVNDVELADVQNLMGSMNAVFSEKSDAEAEAVGFFRNYTDKDDAVAKGLERVVNIRIAKNLINVDLGGGTTQGVETYVVTAESYYTCDAALLDTGAPTRYPQSNNEYIIFSNKERILNKAEEIKSKKDAGKTLEDTDVVESRLANVVVCLRPRITGGKDIITIENTDNAAANLYLVEQETDTVGSGYYSVDFTLLENCQTGWYMTGNIDMTKAALQLRTNFPKNSYVAYTYKDAKLGDKVSGDSALKVMQTTDLTPMYSYDRIYDIVVKVYADGTRGNQEALVTMTGTVIN